MDCRLCPAMRRILALLEELHLHLLPANRLLHVVSAQYRCEQQLACSQRFGRIANTYLCAISGFFEILA